MSLCLTPQELIELTGRSRPSWQARQLDHMGIAYKRRTDGSLAVLHEHVRGQQDARPAPREPRVRMDA